MKNEVLFFLFNAFNSLSLNKKIQRKITTVPSKIYIKRVDFDSSVNKITSKVKEERDNKKIEE